MLASLRTTAFVLLGFVQSAFPMAVRAADPYESDWLIERWNGQWELVTKGTAGRVGKTAPNQEVLRMGQDNTVLVMTMPGIEKEGGTTLCFKNDRHDYRSPCSSAFLDCSPANDGAYVTAFNGLLGFNPMDIRTRLECRINTNAVLRAAKAVGMISHILPVAGRAESQTK
jgi:hypothetical protein